MSSFQPSESPVASPDALTCRALTPPALEPNGVLSTSSGARQAALASPHQSQQAIAESPLKHRNVSSPHGPARGPVAAVACDGACPTRVQASLSPLHKPPSSYQPPMSSTGLTRASGSSSANQLRTDIINPPQHAVWRQTPSPPTMDSPRLMEKPLRKSSAESALTLTGSRTFEATALLALPSGSSLESRPGDTSSSIRPAWRRVPPVSELSVSSDFDQVPLHSPSRRQSGIDAPECAPKQPLASDVESYNSLSESESESEDCCGAPRSSSRAESQEMLDQVPSQSSPLADEPPSPPPPPPPHAHSHAHAHVHPVAHAAAPLACNRAANGSSQHLLRRDSDTHAHQLCSQMTITHL